MTFAIEWLALHIFGVLVAFALLVIVFRKEDTNYKGELILLSGDACGKKYLHCRRSERDTDRDREDGVSWKMFRQLLCPDVYNALEKYKNSTVVYPHASCRECGILYFDCDS